MHRKSIRREGRKERHPCRCVGEEAIPKPGVVATPTGGNALVPRARRDPTSEVLCAAQKIGAAVKATNGQGVRRLCHVGTLSRDNVTSKYQSCMTFGDDCKVFVWLRICSCIVQSWCPDKFHFSSVIIVWQVLIICDNSVLDNALQIHGSELCWCDGRSLD
jgi:hypothetical protein